MWLNLIGFNFNSFYSFLDLTTPFTLGRLLPLYHSFAPPHIQSVPNYNGCVRNVFVNSQMLDFSAPLMEEGLKRNCIFTDHNCQPNPCNNSGQCIGEWEGFNCVCSDEYTGKTCDKSKKEEKDK